MENIQSQQRHKRSTKNERRGKWEFCNLNMSVCVFSRVWLFATPWTVVHHVPLLYGISQARILETIVIFFSNLPNPGIKPKPSVSCIGRQLLYHMASENVKYINQRALSESVMVVLWGVASEFYLGGSTFGASLSSSTYFILIKPGKKN